jgi:hypothetical protein
MTIKYPLYVYTMVNEACYDDAHQLVSGNGAIHQE